MWGIDLIDARGRLIERLEVEGPFESLRDWCRRALDGRADAVRARLISDDDLFSYVYPEKRP